MTTVNGLAHIPLSIEPLSKKDYTSDQEVRWCPGCGDYAILKAMQRVLPELGVDPATGQPLGRFAAGGVNEADAAIRAAAPCRDVADSDARGCEPRHRRHGRRSRCRARGGRAGHAGQ